MVKHQPSNNKKIVPAFLAFIFSLILTLPLQAQAGVFNAETFTLENGLQVIVIPNHRAPIVTHMVWYRVGAADEPQGLSGMAHYFEHLMFKGTQTMEPGEFSRTVKKLGGNDNAFTGQDYTAYHQTIAVQHLEKMMEMEADRMMNLSVPPEHFASEKQVVLEERRQRTENDPSGLFFEQINSSLYVNHPYGTPVIGWMDEIKGYEWNDVKKFYDTWYAPNNAILIISGDTTAAKVKAMAERTYGKVPSKQIPKRTHFEIPPATGDTLMVLHHPSFNQPAYQNVRLAPSFRQEPKDSLALQVLENILSGGPTTRLYKNLVVDAKKLTSVGISYYANAGDTTTIRLYAKPMNGVSLEETESLINSEIAKVIQNGVTQDELNDAIQRLQDDAIFARDSLQSPAMTFGYSLTTGSTIENVENWAEDIATVTAEDVQRVASTYINNDKPWHRPSITNHLLPMNEEAKPAQTEKTQ